MMQAAAAIVATVGTGLNWYSLFVEGRLAVDQILGADEDSTQLRAARRQQLRQTMRQLRLALRPDLHQAYSAAIAGHLRALPQPQVAAFCWPTEQEPDVRTAIAHWCATGSRAALPVVVAPASPLAFRAWTPATPLAPDRYGIPTPATGDWLQPDLLLLPLNAFDGAGYRLGYGGGFFGRTLATLKPRPVAVGVGFEINRVDSIEPETHDERLDWIVTEAGLWQITP